MPAITDVTELQAMENDLAGNYWLANDIDASATSGWHGGAGFIPVGNAGTPFTGIFQARGHSISELFINRPVTNYVGLFGYADGAFIEDVTLIDVNITGGDWYGGPLVGYANNCIITICSSSGSIVGSNGFTNIGGLAGQLTLCTVSVCNSSCSVQTIYCGGGFAGQIFRGTISQCFANGNVVASADNDAIGGFVGRQDWGGGTRDSIIEDCYARGSVIGATACGGFCAVQGGDGVNTIIRRAFSTGAVAVGSGFIGTANSVITDCFWDTETSGTVASDGGTGKTTAQMKAKATFTDAGWDFIIIWFINGVTNDGYPFHWVMPPEPIESPRETVAVQDKITLEAIRNVEMAAGGRFYVNKEGKASYKSRYARNA